MEELKWSLGFKFGVFVDCDGESGGLALRWRGHVQVSVWPWCKYSIDAEILCEGKKCRFT